MVGRKYSINFQFTDAEYEKYETWCKQYSLNGYHGAIGGSVSFEITPTSLGDIVVAYANIPIFDEMGEPSYDKNGKPKRRRVECVIRDI